MPSGDGNPSGTAPTTVTPCDAASVTVDTMMRSTTATTAPGIFGAKRLNTRMIAMVVMPNAKVSQWMSGISLIQSICCWTQSPVPFGTPRISGIWPERTCTPTPVRKPMRTDALRKSPRNPSRNSRAITRMPPVMSATMLQ